MKQFDPSSLHSASTARTYPVDVEELRFAIREVVEELPRWALARSSEDRIQAVCKSRVFGFEDDVTVRLARQTFGVRAAFESASRIGAWDLGQNRRNLETLITAVDRKLIAGHEKGRG